MISASVAGAGIGLAWVANAQNLAVLLSALSSKTNVTVLSTPTLLATDNKEATITVGGRQPIPTGTVSGTTTGSRSLQHDRVRGNRRHPEYNPAYKRRRPRPARGGTDGSTHGPDQCDRRGQQYRANLYRKEHKDHSSCPERLHGGNRRNNRLVELNRENRNSLSPGHTPALAPFLRHGRPI